MSFTRSAEEKEISLAFTTSCVAKQQNPPRNEKAIILTMCSYFPWEASGEVRCSKTVSSTSSTSEIESAKSRSNVFGSSCFKGAFMLQRMLFKDGHSHLLCHMALWICHWAILPEFALILDLSIVGCFHSPLIISQLCLRFHPFNGENLTPM